MTNYNDGKWHGWNGGECPVHPKTDLEAISANGNPEMQSFSPSLIVRKADQIDWDKRYNDLRAPVIAFRVVKEYREPRDFWICPEEGGFAAVIHEKDDGSFHKDGFIHVREVIE